MKNRKGWFGQNVLSQTKEVPESEEEASLKHQLPQRRMGGLPLWRGRPGSPAVWWPLETGSS